MYKESNFEANVKWFVVGFAGLSALCQLIMMFSEFSFFSAVGILFNGLYHFVGFLAPGLIIFLLLKQIDNKEIYSSYSIGLFCLLGSITNICLLVKYILNTNGTEGLKVWLIILISILIILEILYSVVVVKFGLDKVTSFFVILLTIIVVIFKGCVYSSVDSKLQTYAYNTVDKSIFSVWSFMFLLFYLAMIVSLMLYLDSGFLLEVVQNPQNLFSKNTLFGTYTNLYMKDDKRANNLTNNIQSNNMQNISNNNAPVINYDTKNNLVQSGPNENNNVVYNPIQNASIESVSNKIPEQNTFMSTESFTYVDNNINTDVNVSKKGKKKGKLIVGIVVSLLLCGAIGVGVFIFLGNNSDLFKAKTETIDPVSQKMIDDINSIGEVSLDDEELITKLTERYSSLTDEQKSQVTNYATLLTASDELEKLIEEDNKPIALTVENAEEYLKIDVHSDNMEESTRANGLTKKGDYYYYFDVTSDVSPKKSYYFENVKLEIEWELNFAGLTATYEVELNDSGEGSYTRNQEHDAGLVKLNDYRSYFSVKSYTIKEISGNVYKKKPE